VEKLAVLFADICGSTSLYDNLGDDTARRMISRCIDTMVGEIADHQGTLIKTIGDEIMVVFPSVEDALYASCAMQAAVAKEMEHEDLPMHIRIGFNYGEVIHDMNDVFGNVVNVAARVAAITRGGQIMTTRDAYDMLPDSLRDKMRQIFRAEFKGKQERLEIFQVTCGEGDELITRSGEADFRKTSENNHEMLLRYRNQFVKVNKERRSVALGREDACDMPMHSDFASRLHCHIELRYGKFVLIDQSTNGTYVSFGDGSEQRISREEIILHGEGSISLGRSTGESGEEIVKFSVTVPYYTPGSPPVH